MDSLEVFEPPYPKVRIGKDGDGGYIICEMPGEYDIFLSGGINDDISFEEDLLSKYPNLKCVAFDGTINSLPKPTQHAIEFVKKNIDQNNNLHDIINKYNNIFVKMDIETWEYVWLYFLSREQLLRIKQMVIEFHFPHENSIQRWPIIRKLKDTHHLVHIHANNACGITPEGVPHVFECTYIRKEGLLPRNNIPFPIEIDIKNDPTRPQYILKGYPYTDNR